MSTESFSSRDFNNALNSSFPFEPQTALADTAVENWRDFFPEIIGRSPSMLKVLQIVSKIARSDGAVLLYGESGTGKELIASALHRLSPRSSKRFVPLNCSAIPEELLESELFGHEKGAFTGAQNRRAGHFEMAAGGTILLDEIGDMPHRLQAKLLRVLQEKQYTPVGSSELKRADVRIIAATNVDLQKAVASGSFRLDLFYRLNVLPIHIPPLRERVGDVSLLLEHFLELANRKHVTHQPCFFAPEALAPLTTHPWPGNVRELQNLVERLVVISGGGPILRHHLPKEYQKGEADSTFGSISTPNPIENTASQLFNASTALPLPSAASSEVKLPEDFFVLPAEGLDLIGYIETLENNYIMQALQRTDYNKNQAAKLLGLNRTTLVERIKKRKLAPLNMPSKEL